MTTAHTARADAEREGEIRSFALLLQGLEDGQTLADLTTTTRGLIAQLTRVAEVASKAKGKITLTLSIAADQGGTVYIDTDIAVKEPKLPRARSVRWITGTGDLAAENPRQQKLPLRAVAAPDAPRDVPTPKGETRSV